MFIIIFVELLLSTLALLRLFIRYFNLPQHTMFGINIIHTPRNFLVFFYTFKSRFLTPALTSLAGNGNFTISIQSSSDFFSHAQTISFNHPSLIRSLDCEPDVKLKLTLTLSRSHMSYNITHWSQANKNHLLSWYFVFQSFTCIHCLKWILAARKITAENAERKIKDFILIIIHCSAKFVSQTF